MVWKQNSANKSIPTDIITARRSAWYAYPNVSFDPFEPSFLLIKRLTFLMVFQVDYALMFLTVLATVANVLVIVCALKLLRRTSDTMHVFVISLAIGNIMLTGKHNSFALVLRTFFASI